MDNDKNNPVTTETHDEDDASTSQLTDLAVGDEQAEQAKGGIIAILVGHKTR